MSTGVVGTEEGKAKLLDEIREAHNEESGQDSGEKDEEGPSAEARMRSRQPQHVNGRIGLIEGIC
jgi:hypothetical protein